MSGGMFFSAFSSGKKKRSLLISGIQTHIACVKPEADHYPRFDVVYSFHF